MEYPPNPTGMPDEQYQAGVDLLTTLVDTKDEAKAIDHIESVLTNKGVDAALYLLYYGYCVKQTLNLGMQTEVDIQRDFRTLLQTAASIGAYISRERFNNLEKLDRLWEIGGTEDV